MEAINIIMMCLYIHIHFPFHQDASFIDILYWGGGLSPDYLCWHKMTYFTKQTRSVRIWNSFPVLFCLHICPSPACWKLTSRRKWAKFKTLPILMFVKRAGLSKMHLRSSLQMLNLAGAWHLLLSKLPLISNIAAQGAQLPAGLAWIYPPRVIRENLNLG